MAATPPPRVREFRVTDLIVFGKRCDGCVWQRVSRKTVWTVRVAVERVLAAMGGGCFLFRVLVRVGVSRVPGVRT
jgi:hypothetical protein